MSEKIIQFGTGNFLRGFADYFIHVLNEKAFFDGKVVIVKPTKGDRPNFINEQNGRYNLFLRGIKNGEEVCEHCEIHSVTRCIDPYKDYEEYIKLAENNDLGIIISNTTEAGIEFDEDCLMSDKPALSFPGKLTQLLFARYNLGLEGFVILPCELIDSNGDKLKECVLKYAQCWNLGDSFIEWVNRENNFLNTLVDRIVTGFPKDEAPEFYDVIGYEDKLLDTAEIYHLWVIEGNTEEILPFQKAGLNVIYTDNVSDYKKMKVRILNGAHTSLVFASLLSDVQTVGESLKNDLLKAFLNSCLFDCIMTVLDDTDENKGFAAAVLERFANPYIKHLWKSISLNSVSKFSVRVLPTIIDYEKLNGTLPLPLVFSLACLIEYYKTLTPQDNVDAVDFIKENSVSEILANENLWGCDISRMSETVEECLEKIHTVGISEAIKWAMS